MSSQRQRRSIRLKKVLSFIIMGTVCLTAAASVAAMTQTFEVSDANVVVKSGSEGNKEEIIPIETGSLEKAEGDKVLKAFEAASPSESSFAMNIKENEAPALAAKTNGLTSEVNNDINWCSVKLNLRGKELNKKVPAGTVEEVLAYLGIELTEYDSMNVKAEDKIKDGSSIVITRKITVSSVIEKEIGFKTVTKESSTLFEGDTKVETQGEKGIKEVTVEKTYINGKLASEKEISSEVVSEPVDKVVLKGTAEKVDHFALADNGAEVKASEDGKTFVDANGVEREYVDVLTGSGTAYYADPGASTATGRDAQYGVVAVNPNIIPYGSKLYIVTNDGEIVYGDAVAGDTGGGLMANLILVDCFYPTYDECCVFGRRDVTIYILEYGNEFR